MTQQSFEGRTSSKSTEHGTPDEIYLPLHKEFNFKFDLAADPRNTKVAGRANFFTKEDDALSRDWPLREQGEANWLNPPYSRSVWKWVSKAFEEAGRGMTNVVLINHNSEQEWYHDIAVPFAHEIRAFRFRIAFIDWDAIWSGEKSLDDDRNGSYHPSCLLVFRPDRATIPVRNTLWVPDERFGYVSF